MKNRYAVGPCVGPCPFCEGSGVSVLQEGKLLITLCHGCKGKGVMFSALEGPRRGKRRLKRVKP